MWSIDVVNYKVGSAPELKQTDHEIIYTSKPTIDIWSKPGNTISYIGPALSSFSYTGCLVPSKMCITQVIKKLTRAPVHRHRNAFVNTFIALLALSLQLSSGSCSSSLSFS